MSDLAAALAGSIGIAPSANVSRLSTCCSSHSFGPSPVPASVAVRYPLPLPTAGLCLPETASLLISVIRRPCLHRLSPWSFPNHSVPGPGFDLPYPPSPSLYTFVLTPCFLPRPSSPFLLKPCPSPLRHPSSTHSVALADSPQLCPDRSAPSLFEPVHGSAFDIMGKGIANPIGTIWSASMMLDWLGEKAAGERLERAFRKSIEDGETSGDLGGRLGTEEVARAVMDRL